MRCLVLDSDDIKHLLQLSLTRLGFARPGFSGSFYRGIRVFKAVTGQCADDPLTFLEQPFLILFNDACDGGCGRRLAKDTLRSRQHLGVAFLSPR